MSVDRGVAFPVPFLSQQVPEPALKDQALHTPNGTRAGSFCAHIEQHVEAFGQGRGAHFPLASTRSSPTKSTPWVTLQLAETPAVSAAGAAVAAIAGAAGADVTFTAARTASAMATPRRERSR